MIKNIISGHIKELFGQNQKLHEERIAVCRECPLYAEALLGIICNDNLYLNPDTGDVSTKEKDNYIRGCACRLDAKTREEEESCPAGKW